MSVPAPQQRPAARLGAFVALAAFATAFWLSLLNEPPVARACAGLAVIVGGASLLALLERTRIERGPRAALAALALVATTAAALIAIGVPGSTLMPGGWDELGAGIDRGVAGLGGDVEFPYAGEERWSRLILLGGLVCLLAVAAALTFWPRRDPGSPVRVGGLAVLIAIYGGAAAMRSGSDPLLAGVALSLLVAAWLWLPGLGRRTAAIAAVAVATLGVLALPVAAALEGRPLVDYREWKLAAPVDPRSFSWDHSYGPLAPREGVPLLSVRSAERRYWRASVLDRFDGYTWSRSARDVGQRPLELPTDVDVGSSAPEGLNPEWQIRAEFTVRKLISRVAIAPGTIRSADGVELDPTPNGTTLVEHGPLSDGDGYTVISYAPNPSVAEMRAAPNVYAPVLAQHTTVTLPRLDPGGAGREPRYERPVVVPLRGGGPGVQGKGATGSPPQDERAGERLASSPYSEIFRLAERLAAAEPTTYDAVKAIEIHLQRNYAYVEDVPLTGLPLRAFLLQERAGYCEQFSGSMALMLRMLGIPARVATGFSPGSQEGARSQQYLVRDLDAHSWVEVYFTGIGWVPFDPTPASAPAELQAGGAGAASAAGASGEQQLPRGSVRPGVAGAPASSSGSIPLWPFAIALALPLVAGILLTIARVARHRSLSLQGAAEARTRELGAALEPLGWGLPASITLRGLEDRLRSARRPTAAAYAERLGAIRFGAGDDPLPSLRERRRMRRQLRRLPGWQEVFASYLAIPPGAPRRR